MRPHILPTPSVAVVIPCFRVGKLVLDVIARIPESVTAIYVIDDCCPVATGQLVQQSCDNPKVKVHFHEQNQGVGGAVITGYRAALQDGHDIVVKIDGDGQMDPILIDGFIAPIIEGRADYTKGNRFHRLRNVRRMPPVRLFGNAALSFMTKLSSGYWQVFDPTNGYTACHRLALRELDFDTLSRRYFFESDMLFQLNQARAVVIDVPMVAKYEDEPSSLRPSRILLPFMRGHLRNTVKRLFGSYFLRGFSVASAELIAAGLLIAFGSIYGSHAWIRSILDDVPATAGSVMLAALPLILGMQLLLSWLHFDVSSEPKTPLQRIIGNYPRN
ncbi:glycosyltransferase family 2 protein [Stenotrophomonas sp. STM01]|uniref:glycosyltransferase family 2 protein n=1 Tax=Stenotrophomonas sp. STM01 TaxID=2769278 RepID=UPI001780EE39|nr:glycosyltransferase family 2 protein [Stenotrophomonas sp. STM01]MBD9536743.1 glycosyltransferase family 2 protein [Stenotrophomonas sp. STM01]